MQALVVKACLCCPLDVVDLGAMPAAVDSVMESYSRIDLLINNAGVGGPRFLH